jgi:PPK2 family polyphosphate:nucleotide phosphotransferase
LKDLSAYRIDASKPLRLKHIPTGSTGKFKNDDEAEGELKAQRKQLSKLQEVMYAGSTDGLLIVLQGMDTAGKDGTIRGIFDGVNPQGCNVASFKVPTPVELKHDFLWRVHPFAPARGMIGIFNRSHYEDVLAPVVHGTIDRKTTRQRMKDICAFESLLSHSGITVLKFFLHISQEEQSKRLQSRIDDKDKHWKLSAGDFAERKFWSKYQQAYDDIFAQTSTPEAPWYIIPADHKWHRNVAISTVIVSALKGLKLEYPKSDLDVSTLHV